MGYPRSITHCFLKEVPHDGAFCPVRRPHCASSGSRARRHVCDGSVGRASRARPRHCGRAAVSHRVGAGRPAARRISPAHHGLRRQHRHRQHTRAFLRSEPLRGSEPGRALLQHVPPRDRRDVPGRPGRLRLGLADVPGILAGHGVGGSPHGRRDAARRRRPLPRHHDALRGRPGPRGARLRFGDPTVSQRGHLPQARRQQHDRRPDRGPQAGRCARGRGGPPGRPGARRAPGGRGQIAGSGPRPPRPLPAARPGRGECAPRAGRRRQADGLRARGDRRQAPPPLTSA